MTKNVYIQESETAPYIEFDGSNIQELSAEGILMPDYTKVPLIATFNVSDAQQEHDIPADKIIVKWWVTQGNTPVPITTNNDMEPIYVTGISNSKLVMQSNIPDSLDKMSIFATASYSDTATATVTQLYASSALVLRYVGKVGAKGDRGLQGEQGIRGIQGEKGVKGDKGDRGDDGTNGKDGKDGAKGETGAQGLTGLSAYDEAVDMGFVGSIAEWLASFKGAQGIQGIKGDKGDTGAQGPKGDKGDTGPAGKDAEMPVIGGRNYILNSSGLNASYPSRPILKGHTADTASSISYLSTGIQTTNNGGNKEWFYGLASAWSDITKGSLVAGNTYTFSVKVKGDVPQVAIRVGIRSATRETSFYKYTNITNDTWTKAVYTFTIPSDTTDIFLRVQGANNNQFTTGFVGGETFLMKELKLEAGNVPTDWTPAPEDMLTGALSDFRMQGQTLANKLNDEFASRGVNVKWFGAKGDGVTDDTQALQSTIDYAYDFKWLGSVKATKDAMNSKDIKTVFIPAGNYRITSSLLLAPYVTIMGEANQGFTSNKQTSIIGDFVSETDAIIDTAPYDVNGNRIKHAQFSAKAWDGSLTTGTPGFMLKNISFIASKNANIRAGLHRCGGIQSQVINCSFEKGEGRMAIGIDSSLVWNGILSHNHIVTSLYNLYNHRDITQDVQEFNYLTISGEKPVIPDYMFPVDTYKGLSANIFNGYADVHYYSNICEHADIGILASYSTNVVDINNYYEDVNKFVYVMHTVGGNLSPKWLIAPNADLLKGYAVPKMHIDLTSTSYLSVNSIGVVDSYSGVVKISGITGFKNFSKRIIYVDVVQSGTVKIYVSSTGSDDYTGYSASFPVKTLQGAISRTIQGMQNNIIIKDNDTIETEYSYGDGTNTTTKVIDIPELNIVSDAESTINVGSSLEEVHGLPSGIAKITIKNITLNLPSPSKDYKPFATTNSMLDLSIINSKINGGFLAGTKGNVSGFIIATLSSSTLTNTTIFDSGGNDKNLLFIEKSNLSSFNNSTIGTGTSLFTQDNL